MCVCVSGWCSHIISVVGTRKEQIVGCRSRQTQAQQGSPTGDAVRRTSTDQENTRSSGAQAAHSARTHLVLALAISLAVVLDCEAVVQLARQQRQQRRQQQQQQQQQQQKHQWLRSGTVGGVSQGMLIAAAPAFWCRVTRTRARTHPHTYQT